MDDELIGILKDYLQLPRKIHIIESKLKMYSRYYYATHSLIGTVIFDRYSDDYQRTQSVDHCVAEIIAKENSFRINLNSLKKRFELFTQGITLDEQTSLRNDLYADLELLKKATDWVIELEEYNQFQEAALELKIENRMFQLPTAEDTKKVDELEMELEVLFG